MEITYTKMVQCHACKFHLLFYYHFSRCLKYISTYHLKGSQTYEPGTWEVEAERVTAPEAQQIWDQPGLHETPQEKKNVFFFL